jgi:pyrimidine-nucleoside phosphorylase
MRAVDLIARKRDGGTLSTAEIEWLINGYAHGDIPDYQMAAWAMAVLWRGMDLRETTDLTLAMAQSGTILDLSDIAPMVVDKHSTGGVGDKTTLLLAPLVAALDLPVAKMSGRGLGFSGGTIDKLESIPRFRTILSPNEFRQALREVGLVIAAQTENLAPADKQLYALRDVTATVESLPLIAASIMSKKLAAGATCIVLDVKYGSGAFMPTLEQARLLAQTMVGIGYRAGRRMTAVISSMEQPLGYAIGNALEVHEAIAALRGSSPADLVQLCLELGAQLAILTGLAPERSSALTLLNQAYTSGTALHKFRQMIIQQGGDPAVLDDPTLLPRAPVVVPLRAQQAGYVTGIHTRTLGTVLNDLGGGRKHKGDRIDPAVGLQLSVSMGDQVAAGDTLLHIHAASEEDAARVMPSLHAAYRIHSQPIEPPPLVAEIVTGEPHAYL